MTYPDRAGGIALSIPTHRPVQELVYKHSTMAKTASSLLNQLGASRHPYPSTSLQRNNYFAP